MCDFRIGIGTPGDRQCTQPFPTKEQCVLNDDTRGGSLDVWEFVLRADVAGSVDPRIGSLQEIVDRDSGFGAVLDARGFEIHAFDVRRAPDPDQNFIDSNRGFVVVADELDDFFLSLYANPDGLGIEMNSDPIARKRVGKNLRGVPLLMA